ncbi:MAG TPA: RluA family pseudouridine synthase, partial [Firmicutes bacterium]|nr:RluA family pseudouridine synthase [Bacillota bacterium]
TRRVKAGDELRLEFFDEQTGVEPEKIPLNIVYEDHYLLVINKPAGMPAHPTGPYQKGTAANAISHYWQASGLVSKVRLVHRLDIDTSGLILVAKDPYTLQRLLRQLCEGKLIREYLALVEGVPRAAKGIITDPIGRSPKHGVKRIIEPAGKEAKTTYEVIKGGVCASLLKVRLGSGRTHQIRVHLASKGHPVLGDPLYNKALPQITGQALHAWRLEFEHPRQDKRVVLSCPMPQAMLDLWKEKRCQC